MIQRFKIILAIVLFGFSDTLCTQTLDVHIINIRNTEGQLCLAIFNDEAGFKAEKPCWELKFCKKDIVNGEFHIQIPFKEGKWGFTVLDDENKSGKMEYSFLGIPREGVGFSNYLQKGVRKPTIDDFSFEIKKNETKIVSVKMKYF